MSINPRTKGQRAEREVIDLLQPWVNQAFERFGKIPPKLQRNTLQSDSGGCDLTGLEWLALEVKHQETFSLKDWWAQTVRQSVGTNEAKEPVLFYRKNGLKWRVRCRGGAGRSTDFVPVLVDISLEAFLLFFRKRLTKELTIKYGNK